MNDIKPVVPQVEDIGLFKSEDRAFAIAVRENKPSPIPADEMLITNVNSQGLIDSPSEGHEVAVSIPKVRTVESRSSTLKNGTHPNQEKRISCYELQC